MKYWKWQILLGALLVGLSAAVYSFHYLVFKDPHHIFIYMIGDVAFVFIEILLVTMIIHRLLEQREKKLRREKLNMVIGVFFSEVGTTLLEVLWAMNLKMHERPKELASDSKWTEREFARVIQWLNEFNYEVEPKQIDWINLKEFFMERRDFLLRLLENPNLLEHEKFTELLQAVFHLGEELTVRDHFEALPKADYHHLSIDIERVYVRLVQQWLSYMKYLKGDYPYLFSLALRINPFDQSASPVVKE